jgi:hypothetical protein
MSDPIYNIIERLALIEGKTTPVSVKHGLNPQQRSAGQLPALFKPRDISPTLSKKPYQKHPMDGKLVGDSVEPKKNALEEAMQGIEEDMLGKVKANFADYLEKLERENRLDRRLVRKAKAELNIDDDPQTEGEVDENATWDQDVQPIGDPADSEVAHGVEDHIAAAVAAPAAPMSAVSEGPVKTYDMEDGSCLECWGDDKQGYELRRNNKSLPSRFQTPDEADVAVRLFQKRRQKQDLSQDYIEER